jgi:Zn-dependent protease/CBS domain-containing protein
MTSRRGIDVFRVAGIQIAIDYSWLVIFLLVLWSLSAGYFPRAYPGYDPTAYWGIGAAATILFFASVVVHELAHALVANRLGQPVRRITLFIFGGMAHLSREPSNPRTEIGIAAVGPATSFALAGLFWAVAAGLDNAGAAPLWIAMFQYLGFINLSLAVFNLLPGFPLDGGRIVRGILWLRSGDLRRATARAADWGSGIGFGLMALGVLQIFTGALVGGLWLVFIGMFLRGAAQSSYQSMMVEQALGGARVRDLMIPDPVVAPADITVNQAIENLFLRHGFGGFPVARDGEIEGLVSLRQVRVCPSEERTRRRVRDIMQPMDGRNAIPSTASVGDALGRMVDGDCGRLLVTDGGHVVGLITRTGIARFVKLRSELDTGEDDAEAAAV